jgi:penicillin-binding protein 1B
MNSFMKDVVNRGTAAKVRARGFKANVAGKTGTSRDGWFAGFTPNLVCVVWVGFDDGSQLGLTGANSALPIWSDFMQVALAEHPEWQGDWQMPEGIQLADIDVTTGQLTTPENPNRRSEMFINGTLPTPPTVEPPVEEATPDGEEQTVPEDGEATPTPVMLPTPTTRPRPEPRPGEGGLKLEGSITLDIDPSTGLIAVESCPVIRTKTFAIGTEPRTYCGPEYHRGKGVDPVSRPRVVATPPQ